MSKSDIIEAILKFTPFIWLTYTLAALWLSLVMWRHHKNPLTTTFFLACTTAAFCMVAENLLGILLYIPLLRGMTLSMLLGHQDTIQIAMNVNNLISVIAWATAGIAFTRIALKQLPLNFTPAGEISDAQT